MEERCGHLQRNEAAEEAGLGGELSQRQGNAQVIQRCTHAES